MNKIYLNAVSLTDLGPDPIQLSSSNTDVLKGCVLHPMVGGSHGGHIKIREQKLFWLHCGCIGPGNWISVGLFKLKWAFLYLKYIHDFWKLNECWIKSHMNQNFNLTNYCHEQIVVVPGWGAYSRIIYYYYQRAVQIQRSLHFLWRQETFCLCVCRGGVHFGSQVCYTRSCCWLFLFIFNHTFLPL